MLHLRLDKSGSGTAAADVGIFIHLGIVVVDVVGLVAAEHIFPLGANVSAGAKYLVPAPQAGALARYK